MVNERQKRQIKKLVINIKKARNEGKDEQVIKARTQDLYHYLESEGIVNQFDE